MGGNVSMIHADFTDPECYKSMLLLSTDHQIYHTGIWVLLQWRENDIDSFGEESEQLLIAPVE